MPLVVLPFLFQFIYYGELSLSFASVSNEYWFTYILFFVFVAFYIYRVIVTLVERLLSSKLSMLLEPLIAFISIVALRYIVLPLEDIVPQIVRVYWLYKYFLLGYFVAKHKGVQNFLTSDWGGFFASLLLLVSIVLHYHFELEFFYGVSALYSIANLMAVSAFAFAFYVAYRLSGEPPTKLKDVFAYLGKQSLGIYLVHYFFLFDMSWLRPYFDAITSSHLRLGADVLVSLGLSLLVLVPTLLVVSWIQTNRYLAFLLLGEPLPKKRD